MKVDPSIVFGKSWSTIGRILPRRSPGSHSRSSSRDTSRQRLSKGASKGEVVRIVPTLLLLLLLFTFGRYRLTSHILFVVVPSFLTFWFLVGDCIDRCGRPTTTNQIWLICLIGMDSANFEISWTTMNSIILGLEVRKDTGERGNTDTGTNLELVYTTEC